MNLAFWIVIVTMLLGLFYSWSSRINSVFFFGCSAAPELRQSAEGRAITRRYRGAILSATAVAMLAARAGARSARPGLGFAGLLVLALLHALVFARANRRVRDLMSAGAAPAAEPVRQTALLEQPKYRVPGVMEILLPPVLCLLAYGAAAALTTSGAGMAARWAALARGLVVHGFDGLLGMFMGLMTASVIWLLVLRSSARLRTRMAQYSMRAGLVMEWLAFVLLVVILAYSGVGATVSRHASKGILLAALIAAACVLVWNQARSRIFVPAPVEMGADDRWRWGQFYANRSDPALFVQSRCGAGFVLNYGRVAAWIITLGVMAYLVWMMFVFPART